MSAESLPSGKKTGFRGPSPDVGKKTQFKPKQSGNPSGRPKNPIADGLRERLSDPVELKAFIDGIMGKAKTGDTQAFKEIRDTTEGKPAETVKLDGGISIDVCGRREAVKQLVSRIARPSKP